MTAAALVEHRLGPADQVPLGEGRAFVVGGHRIAVFRPRGAAVAATQADCPHRGGPLADGMVGMDAVVCPLHARRFALTGGDGDCDIARHPCRIDEEGDLVVALPPIADL